MLEMSALKLFTVAYLRYQLSLLPRYTPHRRSTTVFLETYPLHYFVNYVMSKVNIPCISTL